MQWLDRETGWNDDNDGDGEEDEDGGGGEGTRELVAQWCDLILGRKYWAGQGASVLDCGDAKVPDGLRYHVLDVWVDGLTQCEHWKGGKGTVMRIVEEVVRKGATKVLRDRAKGALADSRLESQRAATPDSTEGESGEKRIGESDGDDGFEGFED